MTRELPSYPRLHVTNERSRCKPPALQLSNGSDAVANAFEVATGWVLPRGRPGQLTGSPLEKSAFVQQTTAVTGDATLPVSVERWRAAQLAAAVSDLFKQINELQSALQSREAELAIGVPVSARRLDEVHLAARLQMMLRNGARVVGCQAAGLYLLDDTTTELKLRACWGLPQDRLLQPARQLAEAYAELEALIGQAVVLEDVSLLPHWKIPEPFPAALCLPVSGPTDPLGTLWLFAEAVRDFSDQEVHLAEIIAGSIAAELQREVLLSECIASKQTDRQMIQAVQWQQNHLPNIEPVVDGWEVAAWTIDDDELANGFYDWFVPPDGSMAVVVGCCDGLPLESALSSAALQSCVRAHAEHLHDPSSMISQTNTSVWNASTGGHDASLFYCKAIPASGEVEFATAGNIQGILVRTSGAELIPARGFQLGCDPDIVPEPTRVTLSDDDFLLIINTSSDRPSQQLELARQLRQHRGTSTDELLQLVQLVDSGAKIALILKHRDLRSG